MDRRPFLRRYAAAPKPPASLVVFKPPGLVHVRAAAHSVNKKWQKARNSDLNLAEERRTEHFERKKAKKKGSKGKCPKVKFNPNPN